MRVAREDRFVDLVDPHRACADAFEHALSGVEKDAASVCQSDIVVGWAPALCDELVRTRFVKLGQGALLQNFEGGRHDGSQWCFAPVPFAPRVHQAEL